MSGLDTSFAAAMLIGYHAGTHSLAGVRAHVRASSTSSLTVPVPHGQGFPLPRLSKLIKPNQTPRINQTIKTLVLPSYQGYQ
eukprot:SAG11_NODE_4410_length_1908_cov_2.655058_1_plen_81_part_10